LSRRVVDFYKFVRGVALELESAFERELAHLAGS
jgi:hypothetical protein